MTIAELVQVIAQIAAGVGALALVVVTWVLVNATARQAKASAEAVEAMREQAESSAAQLEEMRRQGAPAVVLFFRPDPDGPNNIDIVLKNFGLRPAYDVEITSSVPLEYDRRKVRAFLDNGVKFLAPGQAIEMPYCFLVDIANELVPWDYDLTVSWGDGLTGSRIEVHQPLSLRDFVHDEVTTS